MSEFEQIDQNGPQKHTRRKPLSPGIKGCLGCGVVLVLLVAALSYGVRVGLQKAAEEGYLSSQPAPVLEAVPGGVLWEIETAEEQQGAPVLIERVVWQDETHIAYTCISMPGLSEIMAFGQRGMGVSFWSEEKQREFIRNVMTDMFAQRLRYYDLQKRRGGDIIEGTGGFILRLGRDPWSRDGSMAVLEASSLDLGEKQESPPAVYILNASEGTWTRLADGHSPTWCCGDKWVAFQRDSDSMNSLYRISPEGGEPTEIYTGTLSLLDQPDAPGLNRYIYFWAQGEEGDGRRLLRIDPDSGEHERMEITEAGERLGPFSPTEILHTKRQDDDGLRSVGALDLATGRFRLIRKDLSTDDSPQFPILGGRAILCQHWAEPPDDAQSGTDVEAAEEKYRATRVLSCEDGKLRAGPERWDGTTPSPDGTRVVGTVTREVKYMGLMPVPMPAIAVWEIMNPDEVLTGPESE